MVRLRDKEAFDSRWLIVTLYAELSSRFYLFRVQSPPVASGRLIRDAADDEVCFGSDIYPDFGRSSQAHVSIFGQFGDLPRLVKLFGLNVFPTLCPM